MDDVLMKISFTKLPYKAFECLFITFFTFRTAKRELPKLFNVAE